MTWATAVAKFQSLVWELTHAIGAAKNKTKKRRQKIGNGDNSKVVGSLGNAFKNALLSLIWREDSFLRAAPGLDGIHPTQLVWGTPRLNLELQLWSSSEDRVVTSTNLGRGL